MLSERQETILNIVKDQSPITGQHIAAQLHVTRAALRFGPAASHHVGIGIDARPKLGYFFTGNKEKDLLARIITNIRVESCLSQPVIVGEHTSAYDAVIAMFTEDVGTVFVGTDNILAGVVSRKDLLKTALGNNDLKALPVRMVMTPSSKLIYVEPQEQALVKWHSGSWNMKWTACLSSTPWTAMKKTGKNSRSSDVFQKLILPVSL